MDLARLVLAWGVVWLTGAGMLQRAYMRTASPHARTAASDARTAASHAHPAWVAGAGFLVGGVLLVLELALVSRVGLSFGVLTIGVPFALAALLLWWPTLHAVRATRTADRRAATRGDAGPSGAGRGDANARHGLAFWLLLAWLVVHALLLLGEVLRRPLYAWDAWTQWATKAKVWFGLGHMVPFLDSATWLSGTTPGYFDVAPHYPALVPLWQVWSSVALGRYDDALMNLPWWLVAVALALALYGFLRMRAFTPLAALAGTWLIVSMPILEAHVALAGYADLPLSAYLACAALAGVVALDTRSRVHGCVALALALALPMIKIPGWVWLATLVPGVVVALLPRHGMRIAAAGWLVGVLVVLALSRFDTVILNYRLHLQLDLPWRGLVDAYLSYANWHLLFWLLPGVLLVGHRVLDARGIAPLTAVMVSGALFLLLGFSLSNAYLWVQDQSTVNRATLHLAPLLAVWMLLIVQRVLAAPVSQQQAMPAPEPALRTPAASGA
jgi:hypothetical protein